LPAVPSTSPRQRPDRPIESVALKIQFRADRETTARIRELVPSAVVRGGVCEVKIEAEQPAEVAEQAKILLEKIRAVV
jgi:hypothetical protein